jgi:prepilin-type N-terminal cleavage/methylation domain-containing protein
MAVLFEFLFLIVSIDIRYSDFETRFQRSCARLSSACSSNNALQTKSLGAFTLIELLVVIAIISVLIGLAFPSSKASRIKPKSSGQKRSNSNRDGGKCICEYGRYPTDAPLIPMPSMAPKEEPTRMTNCSTNSVPQARFH